MKKLLKKLFPLFIASILMIFTLVCTACSEQDVEVSKYQLKKVYVDEDNLSGGIFEVGNMCGDVLLTSDLVVLELSSDHTLQITYKMGQTTTTQAGIWMQMFESMYSVNTSDLKVTAYKNGDTILFSNSYILGVDAYFILEKVGN
ncbi:MAG: hypothetical protein IJX98_06945 [Clostridia bacterium]|nr:hypothetical protein [Clostridia bacterium]